MVVAWEWEQAWLGLSSFRRQAQCRNSAGVLVTQSLSGLPALAVVLHSANPVPLLLRQGHILGSPVLGPLAPVSGPGMGPEIPS
jgi:hypothetical protein